MLDTLLLSNMRIENCKKQIDSIDFNKQSFTTQKKTWSKYTDYEDFNKFYTTKFLNTESCTITREDLFKLSSSNFIEKVFSIIFWGYSGNNNMRGNNFKSVLDNIEKIKSLEHCFKDKTNYTKDEFVELKKQFTGTGIGLSTLTKLLYFFKITIDNYKCVILDRKIIDVLKNKKYEELFMLCNVTYENGHKHYFDYIKLITEISIKYNFKEDQLEMFLYKEKL